MTNPTNISGEKIQKVLPIDEFGNPGNPGTVQNPVPSSLNRVYAQDVDLDRSDNFNFGSSVDDILSLFNGLHTSIKDVSGNPVKVILIYFNWSVISSGISIECNDPLGFSNTKVEILRGNDQAFVIRDDSTDGTILNSEFYAIAGSQIPLPPVIGFNAIRLTFSTTNDICLTNINIAKANDVISYMLAEDKVNNILEFLSSTQGLLNVFSLEKEYEAYVNKWGQNEDIDTGSIPETIYDGSDLYTYTDDAVGATYAASSDNVADTGLVLVAELITLTPVSGDFQQEIVNLTLNGQTPVDFAPPSGNLVVGCNRVWNGNGIAYAGTIYVYENTATVVGGIPTLSTLIRSIVTPSAQQTRQAVYIIPDLMDDGTRIREGHILAWDVKITKTTSVTLDAYLMVKEINGVFRARDIDTATNNKNGGDVFGDRTPIKIPTKSKVEIRAVSISANNGSAVGKFKMQLVTENEPN